MAEPLGTLGRKGPRPGGQAPYGAYGGQKGSTDRLAGQQAWWDSLLAMGSVDKKRILVSESGQNVALSSLFFSLCFPV